MTKKFFVVQNYRAENKILIGSILEDFPKENCEIYKNISQDISKEKTPESYAELQLS